MFKRFAPLFLSGLLGLGLLGWWMSQWYAPLPDVPRPADKLWRTITKTNTEWSIAPYTPESTGFFSYQKGKLLLYGMGTIAAVQHGNVTSLSLPDGSQWIIRSLDPDLRLQIKTSNNDLITTGEGALFVDTVSGNIINFDINMMIEEETVLPSFLVSQGKQTFFDITQQTEVVPADLWSLYTRFIPLDRARVLGNTQKKDIDRLIQSLLEREPSTGQGIFRYDLRAKKGLQDIRDILSRIERGDVCGADTTSCLTGLKELLTTQVRDFPEVFAPVQTAIYAWLQLDAQTQAHVLTWQNIFHLYHENTIIRESRARAIRDSAILEMVRSGTTDSQYEVWQYLTHMLSDQKLGSVYSMQIMREMIRIGAVLSADKKTSDDVRSTLTSTAIESLANLRNILENAYFTKKEYWFVLRTDLVDTAGKAIQHDALTQDLQGLIQQIDTSPLLHEVSTPADRKNLATIRGQLAWFRCIFTRNTEYVANPRVCRTTISS